MKSVFKRITAILLIAMLLCCTAACGDNESITDIGINTEQQSIDDTAEQQNTDDTTEQQNAIKYGDTITADVDTVVISADTFSNIEPKVYNDVQVELSTGNGMLSFNGTQLTFAQSQAFFRAVKGAQSGDRVTAVLTTDDEYVRWNIVTNDISHAEASTDNAPAMQELLSAAEENTYICSNDHIFAEVPDTDCYYVLNGEFCDTVRYEKVYDANGSILSVTNYLNGALFSRRYYNNNLLEKAERYIGGDKPHLTELFYYENGLLVRSEEIYEDGSTYCYKYDEWRNRVMV